MNDRPTLGEIMDRAKRPNKTLRDYRWLAVHLLGAEPDCPALAFLDRKIAEQGKDEKVISDEGQAISALIKLGLKAP